MYIYRIHWIAYPDQGPSWTYELHWVSLKKKLGFIFLKCLFSEHQGTFCVDNLKIKFFVVPTFLKFLLKSVRSNSMEQTLLVSQELMTIHHKHCLIVTLFETAKCLPWIFKLCLRSEKCLHSNPTSNPLNDRSNYIFLLLNSALMLHVLDLWEELLKIQVVHEQSCIV